MGAADFPSNPVQVTVTVPPDPFVTSNAVNLNRVVGQRPATGVTVTEALVTRCKTARIGRLASA